MNSIRVKDENDRWCHIPIQNFVEVYDISLFGMSFNNIIDLKAEYEKRNRTLPMTRETIREVFKI